MLNKPGREIYSTPRWYDSKTTAGEAWVFCIMSRNTCSMIAAIRSFIGTRRAQPKKLMPCQCHYKLVLCSSMQICWQSRAGDECKTPLKGSHRCPQTHDFYLRSSPETRRWRRLFVLWQMAERPLMSAPIRLRFTSGEHLSLRMSFLM